LQKLCFLFPC